MCMYICLSRLLWVIYSLLEHSVALAHIYLLANEKATEFWRKGWEH